MLSVQIIKLETFIKPSEYYIIRGLNHLKHLFQYISIQIKKQVPSPMKMHYPKMNKIINNVIKIAHSNLYAEMER